METVSNATVGLAGTLVGVALGDAEVAVGGAAVRVSVGAAEVGVGGGAVCDGAAAVAVGGRRVAVGKGEVGVRVGDGSAEAPRLISNERTDDQVPLTPPIRPRTRHQKRRSLVKVCVV